MAKTLMMVITIVESDYNIYIDNSNISSGTGIS